jgi:hypothetical protein
MNAKRQGDEDGDQDGKGANGQSEREMGCDQMRDGFVEQE